METQEAQKTPEKPEKHSKKPPVHRQHRDRMRQRFATSGLDAFADHEALEFLLCYAIPRRDTNETAHLLLENFGSLSGVFDASLDDLQTISGVGPNAAIFLKLIQQTGRRIRLQQAPALLKTTQDAGKYLVEYFSGERQESLCQLCLNAANGLIACRRVGVGSVTSVCVDMRVFVQNALNCAAATVIIAHNHPGGSLMPSHNDYAATDQIRYSLEAVGIPLRDHIIVAGDKYVSLRESGYIH